MDNFYISMEDYRKLVPLAEKLVDYLQRNSTEDILSVDELSEEYICFARFSKEYSIDRKDPMTTKELLHVARELTAKNIVCIANSKHCLSNRDVS